jgi:hypothetical protein
MPNHNNKAGCTRRTDPHPRALIQASTLPLTDGRREVRIVRQYLQTIWARHETTSVLTDMRAWAKLEHEFVAVAASFSQRYGIQRASWSEMGVDAAVLDRSKIAK